ncbi:MAG TPA: M20 family metallopeptidase [Streptosporangiales bacterium]
MTGLLDACRDRLPRMLDDVERLVTCESPSDDLDALDRSAEVVTEVGRRVLGAEPELLVHDGRPHLRWRLGGDDRRFLLLGHHDTVWPVGTLARLPCAVHDGVLRGPGCFDMKTGVVQAFHAVAELTERRLLADGDGVTLLVTADEELGSPSSRELIEDEARAAAAAFVLEASGPGGALKTERKGVSRYDVVVTGRAAHAGLEPEAGVNAGVELAHQILAITALNDPAAGTSVTATAGRIGTTTNTVPALAQVAVDVRARTADAQERVDAAIRALTPVDPAARVEVLGGINRPPMAAEHSATLAALAVAVAPSVGIAELGTVAVGGGSDGNFTAGVGTPTLDGLGAVGHGAHADDEHVLVEQIPHRTALLVRLLAELGGADADR